MSKFKVGDTVLLDGIKKVIADIGLSAIDSDINLRFVGDKIFWSYNISRLELAKEEWQPKFGELVEVWNGDEKKKKRIFMQTINQSVYPYFCVTRDFEESFRKGKKVIPTSWEFISHISKYKPYTEFIPSWIGKTVKYNNEFNWQIVGFQNGKVLLYDNYTDGSTAYYDTVSFEGLLENYTLNGEPFGELIDEN